ncbi:MAG TPA: 2-C-methyl-D-erythritol 4-phosphate cytidylyltransferase [Thermodesulfatator atlanticus]|uniref:2-C-methyl-D-erythritol 4-phosphate cytidylyltransferase n=1 Tax=Thermodesulfatator atlanticus TaxID=501497 RepID=A0A7V5U2V8_9BACT|nr:2-C-methyl-D-erythritol 4-phosphate cytidylyltransferase [Thermodesulfatator atlanticus]
MIGVIIPAGGVGKRVGAPLPKQFIEIAGKPLILHTLAPFLTLPEVSFIVIPCVASWLEKLKKMVSGLAKPVEVVPGGETRQESVARGLAALPAEVEIVLVHDAARPFVTPALIREVIAQTSAKGAALLALPARDTVKEVEQGRVVKTLPRERIYLAQTPQGARRELLLKAFSLAEKRGLSGTDEASLLEAVGIPVYVVPGSFLNFKITTPEDLHLARLLLER